MTVWLERYWIEEEYRMGKRLVRGWFTFAPGWDVVKKVPAECTKQSPPKKVANSNKYQTSDVIQMDDHRKRFASN